MESRLAATAPDQPDLFDLDVTPLEPDVTLLEVADPGRLVDMTDDGCGSTCEQSTCITGG